MAVSEEVSTATHRTVSKLAETLSSPLLSYTSPDPTCPRPGPQRHLYPTGPYALQLWHPGDDIHLVCITDNSANTFWSYVAEKLDREDLPHHDSPVLQLEKGGEVWLHYCCLPPAFDLATVPGYGFSKFTSRVVPSYVTRNLERLQDTWNLLQGISGFQPAFCEAHDVLLKWAESAGLYSTAFGTLDAEALLWMLFRALKPDEQAEPDSSALIISFLDKYHDTDSLKGIRTPSGRSVFNPPLHLAADSRAIIANQVLLAHRNPATVTASYTQKLEDFISSYCAMALVSAECWAPKKRVHFQSQIVAQLSRLPKAIHEQGLTHSTVRIWPYPFKPSEDEWLYLVGIEGPRLDDAGTGGEFTGSASRTSMPEGVRSEDASIEPSSKLVKMLETFEFTIDATTGHATACLCAPNEPTKLLEKHGAQAAIHLSTTSPQPKISARHPSAQDPPASFPPAHHILSRLRWDPYYSSQSFNIGYLDRFEGLKYLPLESWGKATEDEDFVPEHRIRVVRRVNGEVVWDREARVCVL